MIQVEIPFWVLAIAVYVSVVWISLITAAELVKLVRSKPMVDGNLAPGERLLRICFFSLTFATLVLLWNHR